MRATGSRACAVKQYIQRYNARGYLERIERGALVLWRATAQDASGRVTSATLGNGLNVARTYNPYTGYLSFGSLANAQGQNQLSESYNYDALGNVRQRAQYWPGQGFTEDFEYDGLNRLTVAVVAGQFGQYFHYDAVGNMLSKTGVGTGNYVYPTPGSARTHAVKSIPGIGDFQYDANGNLLSGANRTVSWTSFDMPRTISKGNESSIFMYGPDHQRARQERSDGTTTYYAGPMEVEIHNGAAKVKTYWPMGLGVEIDQPAGTTELNWTHLDRLGSVVAISDASGTLKEKLAYDSWGKRRTLNGEAIPDELDGVTDNRGFTGHEMLDKLDLVHMNGRVYDPLVARFMSADPLIQDPEHSQSYNRYTYVWNNPTNLTDPTGFAGEETEDNRSRQLREDEERRNRNSNPTGWAVQASGTVTDNSKTTASNDPSTTKGAAAKSATNGGGGAAERYVERHRSDMEAGNGDVYKPFEPVAVTVISAALGGSGVAWLASTATGRAFLALFGFGAEVQNLTDGAPPAVIPQVFVSGSKAEGAALRAAEALAARDALSGSLAPLKGKAPATVTAGYNVQTGVVAARACGGGRCAEDHVVDALGGNKNNVRFTPAVRPRTGVEVPVCTRCEGTYGRDPFPEGTLFQSDGK